MSVPRQYKRPPVTEAAIELRFENLVSQSNLEKAALRLAADYPISETEFAQQLNVDQQAGSASFSSTWQGIKRSSADRTEVILYRIGSLIAGHLAPHKGWEHLLARVKNAWLVLARATDENIALSRIGVRYINRIDIPNETSHNALFDYVQLRPQTPPNLTKDVSIVDYSAQLLYTVPEFDFTVRLAAASAPSPIMFHKSIILDIDVFRDHNIARKVDEIWRLLSTIRDCKNMVFESSITDSARELFDR